mgnify:CR=1 FL=1
MESQVVDLPQQVEAIVSLERARENKTPQELLITTLVIAQDYLIQVELIIAFSEMGPDKTTLLVIIPFLVMYQAPPIQQEISMHSLDYQAG